MMLDCVPSWKTSAGAVQLPKEVVYQQNKHSAQPLFNTIHNELYLFVFLLRHTVSLLREFHRIASVLFHNLLLSHQFLKYQHLLLGTSCNKSMSFYMELHSTISLSGKKKIEEFVSEQNAILLGLKDFNHSTTIIQTSCKAVSKEKWGAMVKTDSLGKSPGDADIACLGLWEKLQAAEQDQLQVGHYLWWLQGFVSRQPYSHRLALNLCQPSEQKPRGTVVAVVKQTQKEIWKLEVSDHSSLQENVDRKRWPSRYEKPLDVPF